MSIQLSLSQRLFFLFAVFFLLLSSNCVPYYRYHDQNKAADVALNFSKLAFVERNYEKAFSYLPSNIDNNFNVAKLKQFVENMHPSGNYPIEVRTEDYEIIPNSGFIRIYLQGKGANGEAHYYLIVTLQQNNDYKIAELYRKEEPYHKAPLRKPLS